MKLLAASTTVMVLGLLTGGCSSGGGTKATASSTAGTASPAGTAAPSLSGVAASPGGGSATGSSSAAPAASLTATAQPATTTSTSDSAPSAARASAPTGAKAAPIVVCTALPTPQVASLSAKTLTSSREQDFAAGNAYTCAYDTAAGVGGINVTVTVVGGSNAYANSLTTDTVAGAAEHVTPLAGVGDKAFSAQDGLRVLFGDQMIYVAGLTSAPPAEAIVQALYAKLK